MSISATLELVGHRNLPDDFKERLSRVSLDAPSLAARAASTRQAQMVSSIDQLDPALDPHPRAPVEDGLRKHRCPAAPCPRPTRWGADIRAGGSARVHTRGARHALDSCANIFSFGIANATAYEHERRLHLLFEAVGNATVAIASEFELRPVLQNIVDEARQHRRRGVRGAGARRRRRAGHSGPWVFSGMTKEQESAIGRHPGPIGTLGIPALEGRTVRIADVRRHPAFRGLPDQHPTDRQSPRCAGSS